MFLLVLKMLDFIQKISTFCKKKKKIVLNLSKTISIKKCLYNQKKFRLKKITYLFHEVFKQIWANKKFEWTKKIECPKTERTKKDAKGRLVRRNSWTRLTGLAHSHAYVFALQFYAISIK